MINKNYLYLLINKLTPAYCKIGISDDVVERCKKLYGEWEIFKYYELDNANYYEQQIKNTLRDFRVCGNEMFNCPVTYLDKITNEVINKPEEIVLPDKAIILNADIKNIGLMVKEIRKKQGLTQGTLAGCSGVGVRFIVDLEKGKKTCEVGKVLHILRMLGVKLFVTSPDMIK